MDEIVNRLEDLTGKIIADLPLSDVDQIKQFMDKRQRLIDQIKTTAITETDQLKYKERIRHILSQDERILERLQQLKSDAGVALGKVRRMKSQNKAYSTPFTPDSIYINKRK